MWIPWPPAASPASRASPRLTVRVYEFLRADLGDADKLDAVLGGPSLISGSSIFASKSATSAAGMGTLIECARKAWGAALFAGLQRSGLRGGGRRFGGSPAPGRGG